MISYAEVVVGNNRIDCCVLNGRIIILIVMKQSVDCLKIVTALGDKSTRQEYKNNLRVSIYFNAMSRL